ncbi:DUF2690 domain-containing protein [Actinokineospora diospyrosa]|uniref:DUF2690 domain-containing protein n=1 Tax=Actinokineospora diospyrosa TaxID=103728 RepID=A0ABT1IEI4_9PSEU|nr:DUF2690 domain-containing protein [Actinokineospora diospyrosa]MCP2271035.1 Protein of unknown function (DUF2690) [Actinokineospora diospyrosa]
MSASPDPPEAADSTQAFTADLRRLRADHGSPTWDSMARRAGVRGVKVSRGTLHNAVSTGRLPSELAVTGFVMALTGDTDQVATWSARRAALTAEHAGPNLVVAAAPRRNRRLLLVAGAVALVLSNTATGFIVYGATRPTATEQHSTTSALATTGDDPAKTVCVQDAKVAAGTTKNPQFLLEILFSGTCQAGWARITRYDDSALGNRLDIEIHRRSDPAGATRQTATEPDVQSAYTTLIVRADPTDRLCATGSITTGEVTEAAVEPICT